MTLVYRTAGPWGPGKGAPLTKAEGDGNIRDLDQRIVALSGSIPAAAVGITSITVAGDQMSIILSDATTEGPFTLPTTTYTYRGVWLPSTSYAKYDRFTFNGNLYEVLFPHVSQLTFSPTANDGAGHDYYALILSNPAGTLPTGGPTGYILSKVSSADFDFAWLNPATLALPFSSITGSVAPAQLPLPTLTTVGGVKALGVVANKFLTSIGTDGIPVAAQPSFTNISGVAVLSQLPPLVLPVVTFSTSGTATADITMANSYVRCTNSSDLTLTIPPVSSVAWVTNTEITFRVTAAGMLTIVGGAGVTINTPVGFQAKSYGVGATITIKNVGSNVWDLFGLLALA